MLSQISLSGAPSFSSTGCLLESLGRFNFVFGPNGTGKTTISRIVDTPGLFPGSGYDSSPGSLPIGTLVYNRDYVTRTLRDAHRLAGVFILDDENPEARAEFHTLTKDGGTISVLSDIAKRHSADLGGLSTQIERARITLIESAWKASKTIPAALKPMLEGFSGSKEVFFKKLVATPKSEVPKVETLLLEARSAFDQAGAIEREISLLPIPDKTTTQAASDLMLAAVVGAKDVTLATVIAHLDNHDWVSEGRDYLAKSNELCPFCQQTLPGDFLRQLSEYFDDEYDRKLADFTTLASTVGTTHESLREKVATLEAIPDPFVDTAARSKAITALNSVLRRNEQSVAVKRKNPSSRCEYEDATSAIADVNEIIVAANTRIAAHNGRLRQRGTAKTTLVERCWVYFAWHLIASDLNRYLGVLSGTQTRRDLLECHLTKASDQLTAARQRAQALEKNLVSSAPAIERINRLLQSVGFKRFKLAASDEVKDGYRLQRLDGSAVEDSLSDGERTFIAFLYFYAQLESRHSSTQGEALVAVIDDPISSLDSDVLFVVGSLIRRLLNTVHEATGSICQVIVLTHNVQFYIELTYPRAKDKRSGLMSGRRFYELQRDSDGSTIVIASDQSTVQSNYQRLWAEVRKAGASTGPADAGLENVLRRVLENYFTVIGNHPDLDTLMESSSGDEALACRALLAWLHHGSHTLIDDFDYSPSGISKEVFLGVFKSIFDRTNQTGHYEMMMSIE